MCRRSHETRKCRRWNGESNSSFIIGHAPFVLLAFIVLPCATALAQITSIVNSPHNLSATGPGTIRATTEQEICIFCHTPHNSTPKTPLWNRNLPVSAYTVYTSRSLQAVPGQPTGSSKLCLSCHDGTIALGSVLSRGQQVQMAGGITTLPPGRSNLGTDLSDDHPISFLYDDALVARNPKLKSPGSLPPSVKLDPRRELQCTSCHDPHNDQYGNFLVMSNVTSQLCNTCHNQGITDITAHVQCEACHQPHTAPSRAYLLKARNVTQTCLLCHSGQPGVNQGPNIAAVLSNVSRHDTDSPVDQANHIPGNVVCNDCHEGHTMLNRSAIAPNISPKLGRIDGINSSGARVPIAQFEYEVCFKCHDDLTATQSRITRQVVQNNTRLQFAPAAVSYHPVEIAGKSMLVPSLRPGLTTASVIYCTDCHNSETSRLAGGSGPNGPHGSNAAPLLIARYDTTDNTAESAAAYALCYGCHERASILANQSFPQHSTHVVDNTTPCSACHDSHGISSAQGTAANHSHLINFDVTIVRPDPVTGRLEYVTTAPASGSCFLSCHGVPHSPKTYGNPPPPPGPAAKVARPARGARPVMPARPRRR